MFIPERHLSTPGEREHSRQRHTAAGTDPYIHHRLSVRVNPSYTIKGV